MLKMLENKKLGIIIVSKSNRKAKQRVVIACIDDVDLCSSVENSKKKTQEIASFCIKMHEATGWKVQKEKVVVCSWKWKDNHVTNVNVEIKLKEEVVKQRMVNESVKTLGV